MVFVVETVIIISLLYAFKYNKASGTLHTAILGATPVFQGMVFVGILFLLVEDGKLGRTAMMIIIAIVIVVNFFHGVALLLAAVYFFLRREAEDVSVVKVILLIVGAVAVILGTFIACFFRLSDTTAIVGFSMALCVQGLILAWFAYPYWTKGPEYQSYTRLGMLALSALFAGLSFVGILAAAIRIILGSEV